MGCCSHFDALLGELLDKAKKYADEEEKQLEEEAYLEAENQRCIAEQAADGDQPSAASVPVAVEPSVGGGLFFDLVFARKIYELTFYANKLVVAPTVDDIEAFKESITEHWRQLWVFLKSYCESNLVVLSNWERIYLSLTIEEANADIIKSEQGRTWHGKPTKALQISGSAIDNLETLCRQRLGRADDEYGRKALDVYDGKAMFSPDFSTEHLRTLANCIRDARHADSPPFFFSRDIVPGLYMLATSTPPPHNEYYSNRKGYERQYTRIQNGLIELLGKIKEAAGLKITEDATGAVKVEFKGETYGIHREIVPVELPPDIPPPFASEFPSAHFAEDLRLLNALAEAAVEHVRALPDDSFAWDAWSDSDSLGTARVALYDYGFREFDAGDVPSDLTIDKCFDARGATAMPVAQEAVPSNQPEERYGIEPGESFGPVTVTDPGKKLLWRGGQCLVDHGLPNPVELEFTGDKAWEAFAAMFKRMRQFPDNPDKWWVDIKKTVHKTMGEILQANRAYRSMNPLRYARFLMDAALEKDKHGPNGAVWRFHPQEGVWPENPSKNFTTTVNTLKNRGVP